LSPHIQIFLSTFIDVFDECKLLNELTYLKAYSYPLSIVQIRDFTGIQ